MSPLSGSSWRVIALCTTFLPWAKGISQLQSLVWCRVQKWVWIDRPMRAQLGSPVFVVRGRSSSFWTFFQDCVRGQHLCLAHAERSSSHPKTNKYWGFVWLFLALNTNCNWLYSWKLEKNLLRPFCTHFTYPQSRILSPFWVPGDPSPLL